MKEGSHANVKFVAKDLPKRGDLTKHITPVHEGNKPLNYEVCALQICKYLGKYVDMPQEGEMHKRWKSLGDPIIDKKQT